MHPHNLLKSDSLNTGPKLSAEFDVKWTQLALTGLPSRLEMKSLFYLRQSKHDPYSMVLKVGETPKDTLIQIDAPKLDYSQIIEFVAATMELPISMAAGQLLEFKDVRINASTGCTLGTETYPAGFRFQGVVSICDHEAGMDCSLTTAGLHLKAWVPSFELGHLKVSGPVVLPDEKATFAPLELVITSEKQAFDLVGSLDIFALKAAVDIHCQFMPNPEFYFDFQLAWSTLVSLELHAEMIGSQYIQDPGKADWTVSAKFQQTIIAEVTQSIKEALKSAHEAAQAGIKGLKDKLAQEEEEYKAVLQRAEDDLIEKSTAYDVENSELQRRIDALEAKTKSGEVALRSAITAAETQKLLSDVEAKNRRDMSKAREEASVREKETEYNATKTTWDGKKNSAIISRDDSQRDFSSRFGNANSDLDRALSILESAKGE